MIDLQCVMLTVSMIDLLYKLTVCVINLPYTGDSCACSLNKELRMTYIITRRRTHFHTRWRTRRRTCEQWTYTRVRMRLTVAEWESSVAESLLICDTTDC